MQPLALCEIWARNSKPVPSYSIERVGAWQGGGQVGHVAGEHRDVARMVMYMLANAST